MALKFLREIVPVNLKFSRANFTSHFPLGDIISLNVICRVYGSVNKANETLKVSFKNTILLSSRTLNLIMMRNTSNVHSAFCM